MRPGVKPKATRQKKLTKKPPSLLVIESLYLWRRSIKRERYLTVLWAPHAILDNVIVELISCVVPLVLEAALARILEGN